MVQHPGIAKRKALFVRELTRCYGRRHMHRRLIKSASALMVCVSVMSIQSRAAEHLSVKELTKRLLPSLVVVNTVDFAGNIESSATGFVVDADGIIANSLHSIPQGRLIQVRFSDGRTAKVESVHAFDRAADLALLKVRETGLIPLPLGDSDALEQGESIVTIGHPQGHTFSVVQGVVSARREIEQQDMIQVAMPTEQGNSGGPILDRAGTVFGVVKLKHSLEQNVGFAVPINALKPLLEKPNPIPMERWATIGRLNQREWQTVHGARWSQHAGRIHVHTPGTGFGGRSLCISQRAIPKRPYELGTWVKLDDESGAAGLAFESDGEDVHYGFYPTAGNLRLTRFEGPSVWNWTIIETVPSEHYKPGDWNHIKVKVTKTGIECFVNDELVIQSDDVQLKNGKVGLAKFRHTKAVFRGFQLAKELPPISVSEKLAKEIRGEIAALDEETYPEPQIVNTLKKHGPAARSVLENRAKELNRQAERLRQLADWVHTKRVEEALVKELGKAEDKIDLFYCALLLAKNDDPDLDVSAYRNLLDTMAEDLHGRISGNAGQAARIEALNKYLFEENGFHGSRGVAYGSKNNSYVNRVLDDREGQPITLSVVYLELAKRIGIKGLSGASVPGHFMVHYQPKGKAGRLIDVYEGGQVLAAEESRLRMGFEDHRSATKREIIARIIRNLINSVPEHGRSVKLAQYYELVVEVEPGSDFARVRRALARWQAGNIAGARTDLIWLLEHDSPNVNRRRVESLLRDLDRDGDQGSSTR